MDHACFSGRDCLLLDLNQLAPIRDLYAIGKVNNDFLLSITTTNDLMDTRGIYLILGVQRRRLIGFVRTNASSSWCACGTKPQIFEVSGGGATAD